MALVAASAGAAATMWPAAASSHAAQAPSAPSAPAGNTVAAGDLPHSAAQVMTIRAVYQASAIREARAQARRLAAQRQAEQLAAQRRAQQLAAQRRAAQLAAQRRAQQQAAQRQAQLAAQQAAAQPSTPQQIAQSMLSDYGWGQDQWGCLDQLWQQESGWNVYAENPSGAYGIPQALPASKMASAGSDWQTDATTQIKWGLGYIQSTYSTPCGAWSQEEAAGWY